MNSKNESRTPDVPIESYQSPSIEVIEMEMEETVLSGMSSSVIEDF